ncbi:MAG: hypothetical protein ACYC19_05040 [Acidimicrobiales bacterium]
MMHDDDSSLDLNLAAATLRANSGDVHLLLKALCDELAPALGPRLKTERASSRLRKSGAITSVQIAMANDVFEAALDGATVRCSVGHVSGGIRIRNEVVTMDSWIVRLLGALNDEAAHSDAARQALERIVIGGTT